MKTNITGHREIARDIINENGWKYADYDPKGNSDGFLCLNRKILQRKVER